MWIAYVKGQKGPQPQLWMEWPHSSTGKDLTPLFSLRIPAEEETDGLTVLADRYRCPVQS